MELLKQPPNRPTSSNLTCKLLIAVLVLLVFDCEHASVNGFQLTLRPRAPWQQSVKRRHDLCSGQIRTMITAMPDNESLSDNSEPRKTRSIEDLLSELGLSFKLRAEENTKRSNEATSRPKKILYALISTVYFIMFLLYRAYRGFFVLLPAVFRRVYTRLESTVESELSLEDEEKPSPQEVSWKTRMTVSILAAVVTSGYLIGGIARVIGKFVGSIGKAGWTGSWDAAAKEAVEHEGRIRRKMSLSEETRKNGSTALPPPADGLSP